MDMELQYVARQGYSSGLLTIPPCCCRTGCLTTARSPMAMTAHLWCVCFAASLIDRQWLDKEGETEVPKTTSYYACSVYKFHEGRPYWPRKCGFSQHHGETRCLFQYVFPETVHEQRVVCYCLLSPPSCHVYTSMLGHFDGGSAPHWQAAVFLDLWQEEASQT